MTEEGGMERQDGGARDDIARAAELRREAESATGDEASRLRRKAELLEDRARTRTVDKS